jgi:6-phosphofructokinase 1
MKKIKRIGLLTRDCAGINAAIRAVVRTASAHNIEVLGVKHGYNGLMQGDFQPLTSRSVSGILNLGGTILKTSRAYAFKTKQGQLKAIAAIKNSNIDAMIVIGGNGSLTGANTLASRYKIPVIGVPATIDNDVNGVAMTIGADTAVNVALDAIDKIRDTAASLERIFVIEVMGRDCGYLALQVALAGGCENFVIPEQKLDLKKICADITKGYAAGKATWMIVVAEGKAKAPALAKKITEITGLETREVVLGHVQRGGRPTAFDRILAAKYGSFAVESLIKGYSGKVVNISNNQLGLIPLAHAIKKKHIAVKDYDRLVKILT